MKAIKYTPPDPEMAEKRVNEFNERYSLSDKDMQQFLNYAVLKISTDVHGLGPQSVKELIMAIAQNI